jgi:AraC-like DNA-binding protein
VTEIVERSGLPERTFKRRFARATGYSPIAYAHHVRVEEAKRRLERISEPVDEISYAVVYEDPAPFRPLFKRITGVPPGVYRRKLQLPAFADDSTTCARRPSSGLGALRSDHCRHGDPVESLGWDYASHRLEQCLGEQRIQGAVVDSHRRALEHLDVHEPRPLELVDEVTLRQGSGHSAGPCRGVGEHLRRKLVVLDREIGDTELTTRAQDASTLGQGSGLPW